MNIKITYLCRQGKNKSVYYKVYNNKNQHLVADVRSKVIDILTRGFENEKHLQLSSDNSDNNVVDLNASFELIGVQGTHEDGDEDIENFLRMLASVKRE